MYEGNYQLSFCVASVRVRIVVDVNDILKVKVRLRVRPFIGDYLECNGAIKTNCLPDGESNRGFRVTRGDTYHFTIEELHNYLQRFSSM